MKTVNFMELFAEVRRPRKPSRAPRRRSIAFLKSEGDKFAAFLEGLPESFLAEQVTMPPGAPAADEEPASRCCCPRRSTRCTIAAS